MPKRIMVIEDDPDVAGVIEGLFESVGIEGFFFSSGEKALGQVESLRPDLVIMDLMMPVMSGFDIARKLKDSPATRGIPLMAITGYDSLENRKKVFMGGFSDYLPKPFELKSFLKKIESLTYG